jgi:hypothetical protein
VDVLKQLGEKLNSRLKLQEEQLESLSRNEAAKKRATQVKLSRDFRRVEASFKNIQLEVRRKRAQLHQAQIQAQQTQQVLPQDQAEYQQQLQLEDVRVYNMKYMHLLSMSTRETNDYSLYFIETGGRNYERTTRGNSRH